MGTTRVPLYILIARTTNSNFHSAYWTFIQHCSSRFRALLGVASWKAGNEGFPMPYAVRNSAKLSLLSRLVSGWHDNKNPPTPAVEERSIFLSTFNWNRMSEPFKLCGQRAVLNMSYRLCGRKTPKIAGRIPMRTELVEALPTKVKPLIERSARTDSENDATMYINSNPQNWYEWWTPKAGRQMVKIVTMFPPPTGL